VVLIFMLQLLSLGVGFVMLLLPMFANKKGAQLRYGVVRLELAP
jgi:hypothetical protein